VKIWYILKVFKVVENGNSDSKESVDSSFVYFFTVILKYFEDFFLVDCAAVVFFSGKNWYL